MLSGASPAIPKLCPGYWLSSTAPSPRTWRVCADISQDLTPAEKRASMTWAQRLKRVFNIDIETCGACGGEVKIIPKALALLAGQALASIA